MKKFASATLIAAAVVLATQAIYHKHQNRRNGLPVPAVERQTLRDAPNSDNSDLNVKNVKDILSGLRSQDGASVPSVPQSAIQEAANPGQAGEFLPQGDPLYKQIARALGLKYPCRVQAQPIGVSCNSAQKITLDDGARQAAVVAKGFTYKAAYKWWLGRLLLPRSLPMKLTPGGRFRNEVEMNRAFREAGFNTLDLVLAIPERRIIVTRFLKGEGFDKIREAALQGDAAALEKISLLGRELAAVHAKGLSAGDMKPGNVMFSDGKIFFIDLDRGSRAGEPAGDCSLAGEPAWDIASRLETRLGTLLPSCFGTGEPAWDIAAFLHTSVKEKLPDAAASGRVASAFEKGYLAGGGDKGKFARAQQLEQGKGVGLKRLIRR